VLIREVSMKKIVVIGGSVIDIFAYPHHRMIMNDSNPGYLRKSMGGVGRNIAENLVRLGLDTTLITVLGDDDAGMFIKDSCKNLGLKLSIVDVATTPTYLCIMDEHNEDLISVAAMDQIEELNETSLSKRKKIIDQADILIVDTNLSIETLTYIFDTYDKDIYVDTISSQKAVKIKPFLSKINTLKLNRLEAELLSGIHHEDEKDIYRIGDYFIAHGVKEVFITLGSNGSLHMSNKISRFKPSYRVPVLNSTGAGDAFFAGVIYAKLNDLDPLIYGSASAIVNLQDEKAVSSDLTVQKLDETIKEYKL
ncbi:carbohydrate kinase family protein, partial [Peloplasma aerotolerans]